MQAGACVTVTPDAFFPLTGYSVIAAVYSPAFVPNADSGTNLVARGGLGATASASRTFAFSAPADPFFLVFYDMSAGGWGPRCARALPARSRPVGSMGHSTHARACGDLVCAVVTSQGACLRSLCAL